MIRLSVPDVSAADAAAVVEVVRSGWYIQGERVAQLEARVAALAGTRYAVAVSSGTAAVHLALLAAGVRPGTAVAVSAYSWPATANAAVLCGAEPLFVDIEPDSFCMSPAALDRALRTGRDISAVLPVHAFGALADMPAITELSARAGIPVVEDAACAIGACSDGHPAGGWGIAAAFSFHPRKIVTTGEGGVVTTDSPDVARTLRMLRNHGLDPAAAGPEFGAAGFNYRMSEIHAALGVGQLERLGEMVARRRAAAAEYGRLLGGTGITAPKGDGHVYQAYVVLLPASAAPHRDAVIAGLRDRGVEATIGTHHIPLTRYYRERFGFRAGQFPVTDDVAARALTLPLHHQLTPADQQVVVGALLDCLGGLA